MVPDEQANTEQRIAGSRGDCKVMPPRGNGVLRVRYFQIATPSGPTHPHRSLLLCHLRIHAVFGLLLVTCFRTLCLPLYDRCAGSDADPMA